MQGLVEEGVDSAIVCLLSKLPFVHPEVRNVQNGLYFNIFVYQNQILFMYLKAKIYGLIPWQLRRGIDKIHF